MTAVEIDAPSNGSEANATYQHPLKVKDMTTRDLIENDLPVFVWRALKFKSDPVDRAMTMMKISIIKKSSHINKWVFLFALHRLLTYKGKRIRNYWNCTRRRGRRWNFRRRGDLKGMFSKTKLSKADPRHCHWKRSTPKQQVFEKRKKCANLVSWFD